MPVRRSTEGLQRPETPLTGSASQWVGGLSPSQFFFSGIFFNFARLLSRTNYYSKKFAALTLKFRVGDNACKNCQLHAPGRSRPKITDQNRSHLVSLYRSGNVNVMWHAMLSNTS